MKDVRVIIVPSAAAHKATTAPLCLYYQWQGGTMNPSLPLRLNVPSRQPLRWCLGSGDNVAAVKKNARRQIGEDLHLHHPTILTGKMAELVKWHN